MDPGADALIAIIVEVMDVLKQDQVIGIQGYGGERDLESTLGMACASREVEGQTEISSG